MEGMTSVLISVALPLGKKEKKSFNPEPLITPPTRAFTIGTKGRGDIPPKTPYQQDNITCMNLNTLEQDFFFYKYINSLLMAAAADVQTSQDYVHDRPAASIIPS